MNEKLLQYLWNYKLFSKLSLYDVKGNPIEIINFGTWNHNSGPDFLDAHIKIDNIDFYGNIELHLSSSDWILHKHSKDPAYKNIILHAVYQHDTTVPELEKYNIPTIELKGYISPEIIAKYTQISIKSDFIPCEKLLPNISLPFQFSEEFVLKKLEQKSEGIQNILLQQTNDYEATLLHTISYAFGLKINADIFQQLVAQVPFSIIQKIRHNLTQLEALFFGIAGWLNSAEDEQMKIWKREYDFLVKKYSLAITNVAPKFLRLRPPNFPTIRLSQLANLIHNQPKLFSNIIAATNVQDMRKIFSKIEASPYWRNHFTFGKPTKKESAKKLSNDFIDLVLLNAVLPVKYTYLKNLKEGIVEEVLENFAQIPSEKNAVISQFSNLGISFSSAIDTQAFLYLYKNYCQTKKCLHCNIGYQIFKT